MNGLLDQASPSRRPKNRGGGGGDGGRTSRGHAGRSRGRGRRATHVTAPGGTSRLASSIPINHSDLSASPLPNLPNGEGPLTDTESSDESDVSRQERFNNTDSRNQYEQVCIPPASKSNKTYVSIA
jgi:hypothetical protein